YRNANLGEVLRPTQASLTAISFKTGSQNKIIQSHHTCPRKLHWLSLEVRIQFKLA
ncbi:hypothetical protein NDU88_000731, partial [Pleurodeles waltl]